MNNMDNEYSKIHKYLSPLNRSLIKDLENDIGKKINKIPIFYRIFGRVKSADSAIHKIMTKNYNETRKMQDLIGFRIVVYFNDDVDICINLLKSSFELVDTTIDQPDSSTFKPSRINLVFRLPNEYDSIFKDIFNQFPIDNTFEVQIRTVFSEGWHEVEHDLRYKCQEDWCEHPDLERVLNGVVATLETCDWSMITLFDELAYRHYHNRNWIPMLKNKYRVRIIGNELNEDIESYFNSNNDIGKKFVKLDRVKLLSKMVEKKINIPLNLNNLIYITNLLLIEDEGLNKITPEIIKEEII